jgi:hypothetical protein
MVSLQSPVEGNLIPCMWYISEMYSKFVYILKDRFNNSNRSSKSKLVYLIKIIFANIIQNKLLSILYKSNR